MHTVCKQKYTTYPAGMGGEASGRAVLKSPCFPQPSMYDKFCDAVRWGLAVAVSVVVEPPTSNPAATIIDPIVCIATPNLSPVLTCVYL